MTHNESSKLVEPIMLPSLTEILYRLSSRGSRAAREKLTTQPDDIPKGRIPVVVRPETRTFLDAQAEFLGGSVSGVAGAILDGVAQGELKPQQSPNPTSIVDRLHLLIVESGLSVPGACQLLRGTTITLSDFADHNVLLSRLTPSTLEKVAGIFDVRYEWLAGRDSTPIHYIPTWDRNHEGMARRLIRAVTSWEDVELVIVAEEGIDLEATEENGESGNAHHLVPILIQRRAIGAHETFAMHEVWEPCRWGYRRTRHDLKLVLYFASLLENGKPGTQRRALSGRFRLNGRFLPSETFDRLIAGQLLPATALKHARLGLWHPGDFVEPWSHVHKGREEWAAIATDPRVSKLGELYAEGAAGPLRRHGGAPEDKQAGP